MKNAKKHRETLEMADLLGTGLTRRQIGSLYGVSASALGGRFKRMGLVPARNANKAERIDKEKLLRLYVSERLSLARIAEAFDLSVSVIKKAIKLHRLPERRRPSHGGKYFDRLRELKIGNTLDIACPAKNPKVVLRNSASRLGIRIFIRPIAAGLFRVTRIEPAENSITFQLARMDRERLERLYAAGKLTIKEIAVEMDVPVRKIRQAIEAFGLPRRARNRGYGKHTSVLSALEIGGAAELKCTSKLPQVNLHTIAKRLGIKISIKRITDGIFTVRRIG